jgi:hypothetical protein
MITKILEIVTIIIGATMIFYTRFHYVTIKKVVDIGSIVINQKQSHLV